MLCVAFDFKVNIDNSYDSYVYCGMNQSYLIHCGIYSVLRRRALLSIFLVKHFACFYNLLRIRISGKTCFAGCLENYELVQGSHAVESGRINPNEAKRNRTVGSNYHTRPS